MYKLLLCASTIFFLTIPFAAQAEIRKIPVTMINEHDEYVTSMDSSPESGSKKCELKLNRGTLHKNEVAEGFLKYDTQYPCKLQWYTRSIILNRYQDLYQEVYLLGNNLQRHCHACSAKFTNERIKLVQQYIGRIY